MPNPFGVEDDRYISKAKKEPKPSVKQGLKMVADTKGSAPWGSRAIQPSLPKTDVKANMGEWSAMRPKTAAPTPFPKGKVAAGVAAGTALAGGAGYLGYKKTISKSMGKDILSRIKRANDSKPGDPLA